MKRLAVAVLLSLGLFASTARACDYLQVMGFPESCSAACYAGGHSTYYNTACVWDLWVDW